MSRSSTASFRSGVPTWVRVALVVLGLPNAIAGLWAVAAPEHWFEHFPGWDPRLVAAEPPYNAHLASDAGAGLLASGVVLLGAAWLADRRSVALAVVAFAAFSLPHAVYHALNPAPGLTTSEDVQSAATVVITVLVALVLLVAVARHGGAGERGEGDGRHGRREERDPSTREETLR